MPRSPAPVPAARPPPPRSHAARAPLLQQEVLQVHEEGRPQPGGFTAGGGWCFGAIVLPRPLFASCSASAAASVGRLRARRVLRPPRPREGSCGEGHAQLPRHGVPTAPLPVPALCRNLFVVHLQGSQAGPPWCVRGGGGERRALRLSADTTSTPAPAETGISKKAMSIMNSFVNDTFDRMAGEAVRLAR